MKKWLTLAAYIVTNRALKCANDCIMARETVKLFDGFHGVARYLEELQHTLFAW